MNPRRIKSAENVRLDPQRALLQGADLYRRGQVDEALKLLLQAAVGGLSSGQFLLGYHYVLVGRSKELGKSGNLAEGQRWLTRAAEQNHHEAALHLGVLLAEGAKLPGGGGVASGDEVQADPKSAARWLQIAADAGLGQAQTQLAILYEEGKGVDKDVLHAVELYRQAVNNGVPEAYYNLAVLYVQGEGVTRDEEEAFRLFEKAAELNVPNAAFNAGMMALNGSGTRRDFAKASQYLHRANSHWAMVADFAGAGNLLPALACIAAILVAIYLMALT